jgi:AraC family transcriptional regulator of adaptative response/methylated-DNA-[protein]-cysteine methyltransferase
MKSLPPNEEMVRAYQASDASYDGIFFLGVRTTGIFCRPSCTARKPFPQNVEFFATAQEAEFAGYRPCKRCHPLEISGQLPEWADALLHDLELNPPLRLKDEDLRARGLDPASVRRLFLKRYGQTFHAYTRAKRLGKAFEAIKEGAELDDVALGYGYESHSGFREAFSRLFGQAPGKSRTGECILVSWLETPIGPIVAGATSDGICLLEFTDRKILEAQFSTLQKEFGCAIVPGENEHLVQLEAELKQYFTGERQNFDVPVVYPGTKFQERVWNGLRQIPYGETRSYQELADYIGAVNGQRAVGHANGLNRIAIVIPCHRVVNKDGQLGGYGGGLWRKQLLLNLEHGEQVFDAAQTELSAQPA